MTDQNANTQNTLILTASKLLGDRVTDLIALEDRAEQSLAAPLAAFVQTVAAQGMNLAANGIGVKAALGVFEDAIGSKLKDRPRWPASRRSELRKVFSAAFAGRLGAADPASGVPEKLTTISGLQAAVAVAKESDPAPSKPAEVSSANRNAAYASSKCAEDRELLVAEYAKLAHKFEKGQIGSIVALLDSCLKLARKAHAKAEREARKALNGSK